MKEYKVLITETLQKAVIVGASSEQEAHRRVSDAWKNAEYTLGADDFQGVSIPSWMFHSGCVVISTGSAS